MNPEAPSKRRLPRLSRRATSLSGCAIIVLAAVLFVLSNGVGLSDPGLQYDELLFVNAALGDPHSYHGFIDSEILGVPIMLMPYVGALKAWIFTPIFSIFGVSVESIRMPALLLAALALVLAVWLARRLLGTGPSMAAAILLATDPVFGATSRADWGPIVLSAVLRMAALICYFAFLRRGSVRYLWLLAAALSLGLFNKLDYGWFILALCVAALVTHHQELWELASRRRAAVLLPMTVLGTALAAAFPTLIIPAMRLPTADRPVSVGTRFNEVEGLFRSTVDGTAVYQYMTGSPLAHPTLMGSLFPWVLIGSIGVAAWSLVWGRRLSPGRRLQQAASATTFFLVLFVMIVLGIVATRQATGPHHIMLLWPLPVMLAVCLLGTAMHVPIGVVRRVAVTALAVGLAALVVTQARTMLAYVHAYRANRHWSVIWTPEIYAAARAVGRSALDVDSIITADWGVGTQIFALGNEAVRDRFNDEWPVFSSPTASTATLEQQWFRGRRTIIIYHAQYAQIMPSTTARVEAILRHLRSHVHVIFAGRQIEADIVDG